MMPRSLLLFLATLGLACSSPSGEGGAAEASASVKSDPEAKAPGRPPTLPTDIVVLEPADPGAALLPVARPEGLDASGEVVAVVSFQGADGPPELVFVREQRGERACLLQYLELGQPGWTLHADSCVGMKRPPPSDELPHPSPKGEEPPGPPLEVD